MNNFMNWLRERVQIDELLLFMRKKDLPVHKRFIWYYFGGITLFLFGIQVITGMLLLLYYKPGADTAFESVQFLITKVKFGWLIRSIHSWSANLMLLTAFIHLFSNFFECSYRKPRELTWISGMIMFLLTLGFGFSGYLLPWNELAFFATKVGTDIAGVIPLVGKPVLLLLRGGEEVTGATLTRFFGIHISILPAVFLLFLGVHLILIQVQGISAPMDLEKKITRRMPFFPNFALRDAAVWLAILNILVLLAVLFPWELGVKADPYAPAPAGIRPEWYFLFMFQTLKFLPAQVLFVEGELVGIGSFTLVGVILLLWPFFERISSRGEKPKLVPLIGIIAIVYILIMTILGYTIG